MSEETEKSIREFLNNEFDPTDANKAMDIAFASLVLASRALSALEAENAGMRMGRDTANHLGSAISQLGKKIGLLDSWADAKETEDFRKQIRKEFS